MLGARLTGGAARVVLGGVKKMSERRLWGFGKEERKVLLEATAMLPELDELVRRAQPHKELAGLWTVQATGHELDEMYSLVEVLEARARSRKRRELFEDMRGDAVHVDRWFLIDVSQARGAAVNRDRRSTGLDARRARDREGARGAWSSATRRR